MLTFLSHIANGTTDGTLLLSLAIILCAFVLEDLTTVIVGVLAADGLISVPLALLSLYIGIALGDAVLYSIGLFARSHPRFAQYIEHDFTIPLRSLLDKRYTLIILLSHFVPGLRFTTYTASGFFGYPLTSFIPLAIAGGLLIGTTLFFASYWFGNVTSEWLGPVRWGIAGVFLFMLFFIGRHTLFAYRTEKNGSNTGIE